jgi:hypothetical protein
MRQQCLELEAKQKVELQLANSNQTAIAVMGCDRQFLQVRTACTQTMFQKSSPADSEVFIFVGEQTKGRRKMK